MRRFGLAMAGVMAMAGALQAETLTGAEWRVVELAGGALPADVVPTLAFAAEGRFSGHSGCNRMMGGWAQDGNSLTFSQVAGTMMACDEARMQTERRVHQALEAVTGVALTPGGALELLGPEGLLIRATR